MRPVIVIVGRPNVGKSTLYNRLTRSEDALVDDQPGVTRDRMIGIGRVDGWVFWIVDTGGLNTDRGALQPLLREQVNLALAEADAIIFLVDGREGPNAADQDVAQQLRAKPAHLYLAVNKVEGMNTEVAISEFHSLGVGRPHAISARTGAGVRTLVNTILGETPGTGPDSVPPSVPHFAIIGKPNVGKSTLANSLLGESRLIVSDAPGTTRDSVRVPFEFEDRDYVLVDTAGLRRRARITERLEHFSAIRTLRALEQVHVVLLVMDAHEGITEQDARLAGLVWDAGRSMVAVINKWDHIDKSQRQRIRLDIDRKLPFLGGVERVFVSAKYGSGLGGIMPAVRSAYESAMTSLSTPQLNAVLRDAVDSVPPPMVGNRRIRMKYAHQGGKNPPLVVIHGNLVSQVPDSYRRYLSRQFRKYFRLSGTPVRIAFKSSRNPYGRLREAGRN